jgi:hypothetical protein
MRLHERAERIYNSLTAWIDTDRCIYDSEIQQVYEERAEDVKKIESALREAIEAAAQVAHDRKTYLGGEAESRDYNMACDDIAQAIRKLAKQ